jgi:general secretion pathway protein C
MGSCMASALLLSSYFVIKGCWLLAEPADFLRQESAFSPDQRAQAEVSEHRKRAVELGKAILKRNIFDSKTGPLSWLPPPSRRSSGSVEGASDTDRYTHVMPCGPGTRLVGYALNDARPENTRALVATSQGTQVLRLGDELLGRALVAVAPPHAVFTSRDGTSCSLYLFAKSRGSSSAVGAKTSQAAPSKKGYSPSEADYNAGLIKLAKGEYRVKSAFLRKVLTEKANLTRGLRFLPHPRRGHTRGLQVYGIRKGSLLYRLGLRSGDILRTLNGFPLATASGALEAYGQLKSRDRLDIAYFHRGRPLHVNLYVE